jgi:membrane associated rhomboid family serine protease
MDRHSQVVWDWSGLRPSPIILALIVVNVVAFALELILMRLSVLGFDGAPLSLVPSEVVGGSVWQPFTSLLLHDPVSPGHLLGNMLMLWIFGTALEREEGGNIVLRSYVIGGVAGSVVQMMLGGASLMLTGFFGGIVAGMWTTPALGASGAVMGVTFVWLARHYFDVMNFLFLGPIRGRTLMLVMVVIELLSMLTLANTGWGAHLGGMLAGVVLGFEWYRPSVIGARFRRRKLVQRGREIERELRVIKGGKDNKGNKPQGRQGGDDWVH